MSTVTTTVEEAIVQDFLESGIPVQAQTPFELATILRSRHRRRAPQDMIDTRRLWQLLLDEMPCRRGKRVKLTQLSHTRTEYRPVLPS